MPVSADQAWVRRGVRQVRGLRRWLWPLLPPRGRGRLDSLWARHNGYAHYGAPMNGQQARQLMKQQMMTQCNFTRVVETGTYRGTTTAWLAVFGLPVTSIEIDPEGVAYSQHRLKHFANVDLRHDNSVDGLRAFAAATAERDVPVFFYLEAHWGELPLRDEIEIITANFPKAAIMIDDFAVPDDAGYGFDNYGPGQQLSLDYLAACRTPPLTVYFPAATSDTEIGAKRGSVTLTANPGLAAILGRVPTLRRWNASETLQKAPGLVQGNKTN